MSKTLKSLVVSLFCLITVDNVFSAQSFEIEEAKEHPAFPGLDANMMFGRVAQIMCGDSSLPPPAMRTFLEKSVERGQLAQHLIDGGNQRGDLLTILYTIAATGRDAQVHLTARASNAVMGETGQLNFSKETGLDYLLRVAARSDDSANDARYRLSVLRGGGIIS